MMHVFSVKTSPFSASGTPHGPQDHTGGPREERNYQQKHTKLPGTSAKQTASASAHLLTAGGRGQDSGRHLLPQRGHVQGHRDPAAPRVRVTANTRKDWCAGADAFRRLAWTRTAQAGTWWACDSCHGSVVSHTVYTQVTPGISPSGRASGKMIAKKKNKMVMMIVRIGRRQQSPCERW